MMEDGEIRFRFPADPLWSHRTSFPMDVGGSLSEAAGRSSTSNAEAKNLWSFTSISLHGMVLIFLQIKTTWF
jgi:hypothetical protein